MTSRMRETCLTGALGLLALLMTGCDFDRGEPTQIYDDVGELDIDARERYLAKNRTNRAENGIQNEGVETAGQRHAYEVGEMSLDSGTPVRSAKKIKANPAPKTPVKVEAKTEKVSAVARPRTPAPVQAEPKAVKVEPKPVAVASVPVRVVPAPAPAPEYRIPASAAAAGSYSLVRSKRTFNQTSNIGESELGY